MTESPRSSLDRDEATTPDPEDERKPDSPTDIKGPTWRFVLVKVWREFSDDQCTDLAAALTYYAVLAIFPAAVALFALLGVVSNPQQAVQTVVDVLSPLVSTQTLGTIQPALDGIAQSQTAGLALVLGVVGALWSASGYVGAFSRAMNRIYEIHEGRPFWKLRPLMLLITLVAVLLVGVVLLMLVVSGPLAQSIGNVVGLGNQAVTVWNIVKWPIIVLVVMAVVAMLYYATPNVRQPKFRWLSVGAVVAILIWIVASVGFAFYAANFASYNKTYGSLAGVVVSLVFLWLTNVALLLGAEIDSELERGRELQAGLPAERELQLPARDTRGSVKAAKKEARDEAKGRKIRTEAEAERARRDETSRDTSSRSDDPSHRRN